MEKAKEAAIRLTRNYAEKGYKGTGFYEYKDEQGNPVFWRIKAEHPDKGEIALPLTMINGEWKLEEPDYGEKGRPLYNLESLMEVPKAIVAVVEDEATVDRMAAVGMIATTSGGILSETDWSPLKGRSAKILYISRERVSAYLKMLPEILEKVGCRYMLMDLYPDLMRMITDVSEHFDGDCECCGVEIMDKKKIGTRKKKRKTPVQLPLFTPDMLN